MRLLIYLTCICGQAYHNELVSKVSQLEEQNIRLKKEKVVDNFELPKFGSFRCLVCLIDDSLAFFIFGATSAPQSYKLF